MLAVAGNDQELRRTGYYAGIFRARGDGASRDIQVDVVAHVNVQRAGRRMDHTNFSADPSRIFHRRSIENGFLRRLQRAIIQQIKKIVERTNQVFFRKSNRVIRVYPAACFFLL